MRLPLLVLVGLLFFRPVPVFAGLAESELAKPAALTNEHVLLSQVDALCLYLTSERIAHAPRLSPEKVIQVESTVLDGELLATPEELKRYVSRQIAVFSRELGLRLGKYAPEVALNFNATQDLRFFINGGSTRQPIAEWVKGEWKWIDEDIKVSVAPTPPAPKKVRAEKKSTPCPLTKMEKWRRCPGYRGS